MTSTIFGNTHNEKWGLRQASKYLNQLKRRIEILSETPDSGKKRDNVSEGLLGFHEGRHFILYRKDNAGIIIIRVLHDRMDVPERMKEAENREI